MTKQQENEFSIIQELMAPLSEGARGALGLGDDVALIGDDTLAVTKDMLVSGVHFRAEDEFDLVAQKVMRVNISDLIAKGVRPTGYFLGCVWPAHSARADIEKFVQGLERDQLEYKCHLYGGDTVKHRHKNAPFTISVTFFGHCAEGKILQRDGASAGDDLYVTGTLGDAGLGLQLLTSKAKKQFEGLDKDACDFLCHRYWLPQPRMTFASALKSFASAAMDVSDGLVADTRHLANQSGVAATIDLAAIPCSEPCKQWLDGQANKSDALQFLATCGDDYEILFAAPSSLRRSVEVAAKASRTQVTRIGRLQRGQGVTVMFEEESVEIKSTGYNHFV